MSEQKQMPKQKNIFGIIAVVVFVAVFAYFFLGSNLEPIEDINGPDNYELAVITDENIIKQDMGAMNVSKKTGLLNSGITFSSKNFNGVYRVFQTNFFLDSDFYLDLAGFWVKGGNFRMCIVNEGKIIADVEPDMFAECKLSDLNGSFELVIAGESAEFEFTLDRLFCEQYGIEIDN